MNRQFGQFEASAPLHSGPFGTLLKATHVRRRGEFVVKHFNPDPNLASTNQIRQALLDFVERGQIVQKLVAEGATHWVKIYELVSGEGGYCVLDYYPLTLCHLMQNHDELTARELHSIIGGIVSGLGELKKIAGRSHGNLKPENILLARQRRTGDYTTVLTDPGAAWQLGSAGDAERRDLRSVGTIIHDLIVPEQRSIHHAGPSPRWEQLGLAGEGWRSLCNDLIADDADRLLANLEELQGRVAALGRHHFSHEGSSTRLLVGAVMVVVVGAIALAGVFYRQNISQWAARFNRPHSTIAVLPPVHPTSRPADSPVIATTQPDLPRIGNVNPLTRPVIQPATHAAEENRPAKPEIVAIAQSDERQTTLPSESGATKPAAVPAEVVIDKPATIPDSAGPRTELVIAAAGLRRLFDQGYSIAVDDSHTGAPLAKALSQYRAAKSALPPPEADEIAGELENRMAEQRSAAESVNVQKLIGWADQNDHIEVGLLAWRRLDQVTWPADGDPLPRVLHASTHLLGLFDRVPGPDRQAALKALVTATLPDLWSRRMSFANSTEAIDGAIMAASAFKAPPAAVEAARAAFPQKQREELSEGIETLHRAGAASMGEYNALRLLIKSSRPLIEPNRRQLAALARAGADNSSPSAQRKKIEALFPDLAVYRWLVSARALSARVAVPADRSVLFASIAEVMARNGNFSEALETVDAMEDAAPKAGAYAVIAKAQAGSGKIEAARATLSRARNIPPQVRNHAERARVYLAIARGQARSGMKSDAALSVGQAKGAAGYIPQAEEQSQVMLAVCQAQSDIGDFPAAHDTAASFNIPARLESAHRMIACAQADAGQIEQARAEMMSIHSPPERSLALERIAAAQARAGAFSDARATAASIDGRPSRCRAYLAIAAAGARAGNSSDASSSLQTALTNLTVDGDKDKWTLYIEASGLEAELGKPQPARTNAEAITELPDRAMAYSRIAEAQAKNGDAAGAADTLQSAARLVAGASEAHRTLALAHIAQTQARLGDQAAANLTLDMARTVAAGGEDANSPALISAQAAAGDWDAIEGQLRSSSDPASQARILISAAAALNPLSDAAAHP